MSSSEPSPSELSRKADWLRPATLTGLPDWTGNALAGPSQSELRRQRQNQ